MAEPKKPESTRPFRIVPGGQDPKERTQPISTGEDKTERVSSATRPTAVIKKTGPVPPAAPTAQKQTGSSKAVRQTGSSAAVRRTGPTQAMSATGQAAALRKTGGQQAVRRTGQLAALRRSGTTASVGRGTGSEGHVADNRMTDGMRARRREMDRRRRRAALEKMRLDAEVAEGWQRIWKIASLTVLALSLVYGYWRTQQVYGDNWPLLAVWGLMAFAIIGGFAWILWYMNRGDA